MYLARDVVMGLENEYPITVVDPHGNASGLDKIAKVVEGLAEINSNQFDNPIGGRLYRDGGTSEQQHDHFEGCTPECAGIEAPRTLALYNRALDDLVLREFQEVWRSLKDSDPFSGSTAHLIKDCTDWKGNWYGAQFNIRVPDELRDSPLLVEVLMPYLASKVVWTGQGGIRPLGEKRGMRFVFSQRILGLSQLISRESALHNKPFISTVQAWQPHTHDLPEWSRLQLLCDPYLSDIILYIDAGITSLLIRLIASGEIPNQTPRLLPDTDKNLRPLEEFLQKVRSMNEDISLSEELPLADGLALNAPEIQKRYLGAIRDSERILNLTEEDLGVLSAFEEIVRDLQENPLRMADRSPCWLLYKICTEKLVKHNATWKNCRDIGVKHGDKTIPLSHYLSMVAHQFPSLDEWGIWPRMVKSGRVKTLFSSGEVAGAGRRPPGSRAAFRKALFARAKELNVYAAMRHDSWSNVIFGTADTSPSMEILDPTGRSNESALQRAEIIMQEIIRHPTIVKT